jgi:hypothetical protein
MTQASNIAIGSSQFNASGVLQVAGGGTNSTATPTAGGAIYGTGTAHAITAAGTSGNALISAGAGAPAFGNLALGVANTNVSGALTVTNGGTGVATLTGLAYGNGTSAFTAATAAQALTLIGTVPIANGGTNSTATPTAGGVVYGTGTAHAVNTAGTAGQKLISGVAGAPTWGSSVTAGTAVASTSGTAITFTGIPSWAKRVTVMFVGVGTSGVSAKQVQIGSGSVITTGYSSASSVLTSTTTTTTATTGLVIYSNVAAQRLNGVLTLVLENTSTNTWSSSLALIDIATSNATIVGAGSIALSGALDRVNITTVNGTDTFAAGSINVLWE